MCQPTAIPLPLLLDLHHEIVAQVQMIVDIFLCAHLLYLLLLFVLWSPGPIHSLTSIGRLDVLLLLGPTFVHHFFLGILSLLPSLVFHASLCLLDHGDGCSIFLCNSVTF